MFRSSATTIRLTPLLPTSGNDPAAPQCNLLRIESLTILLDCGVGVDLVSGSEQLLAAVGPYLHDIDAVLISSSELCCCGGLALLLPRLRPGVRVIATMATARIGVMNVASHFLSQFGNADGLMHKLAPERYPARDPPQPLFNVRSIYAAFRSIRETHFEQNVTVQPLQFARAVVSADADGGAKPGGADQFGAHDGGAGGDGGHAMAASGGGDVQAVVRAVCAGRCVGGAGFRIQFRDDNILYLGRFAPRESSCLPGLNTSPGPQGAMTGSNIVIVDGSAACFSSGMASEEEQDNNKSDDVFVNSMQQQLKRQVPAAGGIALPPSDAIDKLLHIVRDTLRKSGTVLLPLNAFGNGIEIMHRLELYFNEEGLVYPLVFASPRAKEHLDRLRLLSEFALPAAQWGRVEGAFARYSLVSSAAEVHQQILQPAAAAGKSGGGSDAAARCIVMHTHDCRDHMSALLLQYVAKDSRNLVLFTEHAGQSDAGGDASPAATSSRASPSFPLRQALLDAKAAEAAAAAANPSSKGKKAAAAASASAHQQHQIIRFTALARTLLEGQELEAYLLDDRARRDAEDEEAERESARRRALETATELALLMQEDALEAMRGDDELGVGARAKTDTNNTKKKNTGNEQQQQQHPNLFIAPSLFVKKRVKPNVLTFPAELAYNSTRIQQDFGSLAAANATLLTRPASVNVAAQQEQTGSDNRLKKLNVNSNSGSNTDEVTEEEAAIYGIPVLSADLRRFRRLAAESSFVRSNNNSSSNGRKGGKKKGGGGGGRGDADSDDDEGDNNNDSDLAMLGKASSVQSAEARDDVPAYVKEIQLNIQVAARVETLLTNLWLDGTSLRVILRNNCKSMRKIAFLHTLPADARALLSFCKAEGICKTDSIFCPVAHESHDMATAVFSCEIRMHPALLQQISAQQRAVTTANGSSWQVAWVRGALLKKLSTAQLQQQQQQQLQQASSDKQAGTRRGRGDEEPPQKLIDDDPRPILCPISLVPPEELLIAHQMRRQMKQQQQQQGARRNSNNGDHSNAAVFDDDDEDRPHEAGSIFVGELRLPQVERELIQRAHLRDVTIEHDDEAPLLLANNAVAIRGGSRIAMEAVPSMAMFAARKAFRSSFHIL